MIHPFSAVKKVEFCDWLRYILLSYNVAENILIINCTAIQSEIEMGNQFFLF